MRLFLKILIAVVILVAIVIVIAATTTNKAIEEASYTVTNKEENFEIRDYAPHLLAEILVDGDLEEAGNKAFNPLFRYISRENRSQKKIEMTAPVSQEAHSEKIEMTAPVSQERVANQWAIRFMMPASYTLETIPQPNDPKITIHQIPAQRMAAIRYSGTWSEKRYLQFKVELEAWILKKGLNSIGEPQWARYNPPFTPWFLRRNEILIPIRP